MADQPLHTKKCVPCEGDVKPMTAQLAEEFLAKLPAGWTVAPDNKAIRKTFQRQNFQDAIDFINNVARLAETEGHHPDIRLHGWNKVTLTHSTHAIGGLSENDFILAAKIEETIK